MSAAITKRPAELEQGDLPPGGPIKGFSPEKKRARENPMSGAIKPMWPYFENFSAIPATPEALQLKKKTLEITQTRLPKEFIERICSSILKISSGDLLHYKKKIPLADKSSYGISAFLCRIDNISYAFFSSGTLIDKGQRAKVSEGILLEFEHKGSSVEPLSLQVAAKHILPMLPDDTSASKAYKAHLLLGNCPQFAKIFFQGVYAGKHQQQLLSIMPRYTGSLGHYVLQQKLQISLEALRLTAKSAGKSLVTLSAANLVHRDVKSNNFLAFWKGPKLEEVVLSDFETCCFTNDKQSLSEHEGTTPFFSPEMTAHHMNFPHYFLLLKLENDLSLYATAQDVWGYGVLLYLLLNGKYPSLIQLQIELRKATLEYEKQITSEDLEVRRNADINEINGLNEDWRNTLFFLFYEEEDRKALPIDSSIEGFIQRCLSIDPRNRPSINEVKKFTEDCETLPERLKKHLRSPK